MICGNQSQAHTRPTPCTLGSFCRGDDRLPRVTSDPWGGADSRTNLSGGHVEATEAVRPSAAAAVAVSDLKRVARATVASLCFGL